MTAAAGPGGLHAFPFSVFGCRWGNVRTRSETPVHRQRNGIHQPMRKRWSAHGDQKGVRCRNNAIDENVLGTEQSEEPAGVGLVVCISMPWWSWLNIRYSVYSNISIAVGNPPSWAHRRRNASLAWPRKFPSFSPRKQCGSWGLRALRAVRCGLLGLAGQESMRALRALRCKRCETSAPLVSRELVPHD